MSCPGAGSLVLGSRTGCNAATNRSGSREGRRDSGEGMIHGITVAQHRSLNGCSFDAQSREPQLSGCHAGQDKVFRSGSSTLPPKARRWGSKSTSHFIIKLHCKLSTAQRLRRPCDRNTVSPAVLCDVMETPPRSREALQVRSQILSPSRRGGTDPALFLWRGGAQLVKVM